MSKPATRLQRRRWTSSFPKDGEETLTFESDRIKHPYKVVFAVDEQGSLFGKFVFLKEPPPGLMDRIIEGLRRRWFGHDAQQRRWPTPLETFHRKVLVRRSHRSVMSFLDDRYPNPRTDAKGFVRDLAIYLRSCSVPDPDLTDRRFRMWVGRFAPAVRTALMKRRGDYSKAVGIVLAMLNANGQNISERYVREMLK